MRNQRIGTPRPVRANGAHTNGSICGGSILHVFCWSCDAVRDRLGEIAEAGYDAVLLSPLQPPKDYRPEWDDIGNNWWKLYQPLDLAITKENGESGSWIGTETDLKTLCAEAKEFGVKIIVDVVFNHLANNGASGGTYSLLCDDVADRFKDPKYFHSDPAQVDDSSRRNITQGQIGMPDLNTADRDVQKWAAKLLIDYINCGVDGFRFDAAKHIELEDESDEDGVFGSDFWKNVVGGAKAFYKRVRSGNELFVYGEILGDAGVDIAGYTKYMAVTSDSEKPSRAVRECDAALLGDGAYEKSAAPSDCVVWVESHDTFLTGDVEKNTSDIPSEKIARAWAIVGARADSTALYLARPGDILGEAGNDMTWKCPAVAEVNRFKRAFRGETETVSYDRGQNAAYIVRGSLGAAIAKLDGAGGVRLRVDMRDGSYTDRVSGGAFTVEDGVLCGEVGESGVAVIC